MRIRSSRDLGLVVRDRRRDLGWTQSQLAEEIGVNRRWVSEFEAGKERAETSLAFRALEALDLLIDVTRGSSVRRTPQPSSPDDDLDVLAIADASPGHLVDLDELLRGFTDGRVQE